MKVSMINLKVNLKVNLRVNLRVKVKVEWFSCLSHGLPLASSREAFLCICIHAPERTKENAA
jgi:hypothetical protein